MNQKLFKLFEGLRLIIAAATLGVLLLSQPIRQSLTATPPRVAEVEQERIVRTVGSSNREFSGHSGANVKTFGRGGQS